MKPRIDLNGADRVLCIGAHADDIELGAGGTLLNLVAAKPSLELHWCVLTGAGTDREKEARRSAALFAENSINVEVFDFQDTRLPWQGNAVKDVFRDIGRRLDPDLIFTHHGDDHHQDHRLISELTWNTWRNHLIFEYEIHKWEGDLGRPNAYVPLTEEVTYRKAELIFQAYETQHSRRWFRKENFIALMRIRGVECHHDFAEAFHAKKLIC